MGEWGKRRERGQAIKWKIYRPFLGCFRFSTEVEFPSQRLAIRQKSCAVFVCLFLADPLLRWNRDADDAGADFSAAGDFEFAEVVFDDFARDC